MNRRIGLYAFVLPLLLIAASVLAGDVPDALSNFAAAKIVIGQKNLKTSKCTGKSSKTTICGSEGAAALGGNILYVPDSGGNRVLGFKKVPKKNGAAAKLVLGQSNFSNQDFGNSSTLFDFPGAVATAGNQLFMVDFSNSRVLIWNSLPTKTNTPADLVVGQPNLNANASAATRSGLNRPENGLFVVDGKLLIADRNNNRVLIWNSIPTVDGADADVVVGQPDFTSSAPATTQTGLHEPEGIWSDGTMLVVADAGNNRVLIWNNIPTSNDAPADLVVGQADFISSGVLETPTAQSLNDPGDVVSDGTSLYVEDSSDNRILIFSPFPTSSNPTASVVLGQPDFAHRDKNAGKAAPSAKTLDFPFGMSIIGKQLLVNDFGNSRVLIFGL